MRRLPLCLIALFAVSLFAADFWKAKDPSQWSNDEVTKMLTKSPWAKSFLIQTVGFPAGGDATGGGGNTGGGGGGGRGGGGMGAGLPAGPAVPPIVVRWEGAAPVRAALARQRLSFPAEIEKVLQENYVVSLTGFQLRGPRRGGPSDASGSGVRGAQTKEDQRTGGPPTGANPNAGLPVLRNPSIKYSGRQAIPPDRIMVVSTHQGPGLYLLFSRKNTIGINDNEVTVEFTINGVTTKAKFKLKDMEYHGKLEL